MKIYCLYGHGKETERSYWYAKGEFDSDEGRSDGIDGTATVSSPILFPLTSVRRKWRRV